VKNQDIFIDLRQTYLLQISTDINVVKIVYLWFFIREDICLIFKASRTDIKEKEDKAFGVVCSSAFDFYLRMT
jgi:hypothetical protein